MAHTDIIYVRWVTYGIGSLSLFSALQHELQAPPGGSSDMSLVHAPFMKIFQNGKIRNSTSFGCIFCGNQYTVRYEQNRRG